MSGRTRRVTLRVAVSASDIGDTAWLIARRTSESASSSASAAADGSPILAFAGLWEYWRPADGDLQAVGAEPLGQGAHMRADAA